MPITITATGNAAKDAELKWLDNGNAVTKFSIYSKKRNAKEGDKEKYDYLDVVIFGKRAEFAAEKVKEGKAVYVSGTFETRTHEGKRYYQCIADTVDPFIGDRKETANSGGSDFGF